MIYPIRWRTPIILTPSFDEALTMCSTLIFLVTEVVFLFTVFLVAAVFETDDETDQFSFFDTGAAFFFVGAIFTADVSTFAETIFFVGVDTFVDAFGLVVFFAGEEAFAATVFFAAGAFFAGEDFLIDVVFIG